MNGAVVAVEGARPEIGGFGQLPYEMGFADPRALLVREDNGDKVAGFLEGEDKGVDVGRGLVTWEFCIISQEGG